MSSRIKLFLCAVFLFSLSCPSGAQTSSLPSSVVSEVLPADALWKEACRAFEKRQYQDAQKKFEDFNRRYRADPRAAEAAIRIGICDYRQGRRIVRAIEGWNKIVNMELMQKRSSPALLLGLEQLAAHYRTQHNERELEKTLARLAEFFPENAVTIREHASSARSRMEAGDYAGASALFGKVSACLKGKDLLDYNLAKELSAPDSSVAAIIVSADKHLANNSTLLATRLYEEALKRNPGADEKHEAMTKLGWCYYLQNNDKDCERLWQSVLASAPKGDKWRGKSRWNLVVLNAGPYNDVKKAIELCEEQAKEFNSGFLHEQALFSKAWLLWTRQRWTESKAAFDELIRNYPEKAVHPPIMKYMEDCEKGINAQR